MYYHRDAQLSMVVLDLHVPAFNAIEIVIRYDT